MNGWAWRISILVLAMGLLGLLLLAPDPSARPMVQPDTHGAAEDAANVRPGLVGLPDKVTARTAGPSAHFLRVTVRAMSGDTPIERARVDLVDAKQRLVRELGRTDADGVLIFPVSELVRHSLIASATGYASATRALSAHPEAVVFHLENAHALRGHVVDDRGESIQDAVVVVRPASTRGALPQQATSNASGAFVVEGLAPGEHTVAAHRPGGAAGIGMRVRLPFRGDVELVLPRPTYIEGTVRDASDSRPLDGAWVQVEGASFENTMRARTDAQGRYRLGPLHPSRGPAYLVVTRRGYRPATTGDIQQSSVLAPHPSIAARARLNLAWAPGDTVTLDVDLRRGAVVSGVVHGPQGPVVGAMVQAFPADGTPRTVSDAQGRYRIEGLSERAFLIRAHAPGFIQPGVPTGIRGGDVATSDAFAVAGVRTDAEREVVRDLRLAEGLVAVVEVVEQRERTPVVGARLRVRSLKGGSRPTVTPAGTPGRFRISGLAEGDALDLLAVHPDYEQVGDVRYEVGAGGVLVMALRARARLVIRGTVRSSSGDTLRGAYVQVAWLDRSGYAMDPVGRWKLWQTRERHPVRADGSYEVLLVGAPGRYAVRAVAIAHMATASRDQVAREGEEEAQVDVMLEKGASLQGVVIDDATNAPVAGALILVTTAGDGRDSAAVAWYSLRATTDARGAFHVDRLPTGELRVDVRARGWAPATLGARLPQEDPLRVRLRRADGVLAGHVEGEAGEAIAAAYVTAVLPAQPVRRARSRSDGAFLIEGLVHAAATVGASAPGRISAHEENVAVGTDDLRLVLRAGARAAGRVVDGEQRPVGRAWLHFVPVAPRSSGIWVRTNKEGRFDRADLSPGRHTVFLHEDDRDVELGEVELPADDLLLVR